MENVLEPDTAVGGKAIDALWEELICIIAILDELSVFHQVSKMPHSMQQIKHISQRCCKLKYNSVMQSRNS